MKRFAALAAAAVLTACGGGGSDDTSTTTPASAALTAEGFWTGSASTGPQVQLAILENGETWGFYTSQGSLLGALYGNTTSSGTSVSGSGLDFYNGTANAGTYSGIFSAKNTLNLSLRSGTSTSTSTFAGKYSAAYDQPALLSNLAGTYAGYALTGKTNAQAVPVTISSNGSISAGNTSCAGTGTATPRASGKNIFDIRLTFTGSFCALGNGTVTNGIAYFDTSTKQVAVLALNASKTDGFVYAGVR
jgi:hypothetical protein